MDGPAESLGELLGGGVDGPGGLGGGSGGDKAPWTSAITPQLMEEEVLISPWHTCPLVDRRGPVSVMTEADRGPPIPPPTTPPGGLWRSGHSPAGCHVQTGGMDDSVPGQSPSAHLVVEGKSGANVKPAAG